MHDYKLIEALARVISEGGFERAAQVLFISQSAVSQRIRQLEEQNGQLLLTRTSPPQPTAAGKLLLKHYQQVKLLEDNLRNELTDPADSGWTTLAIGVNADSVASWLTTAICPLLQQQQLLLDVRIDDQEQTHQLLRAGDVVGCVSTAAQTLKGCQVDYLGEMNYRLLASPGFVARWFADGVSAAAIEQAPAILFNRKDRLHSLFFERYYHNPPTTFPCHYVPAIEQFQQLIHAGLGYGMVPDWQSAPLRNSKELVELFPDCRLAIKLYWHCWTLKAEHLQKFSHQLIAGARQFLAGLD